MAVMGLGVPMTELIKALKALGPRRLVHFLWPKCPGCEVSDNQSESPWNREYLQIYSQN